ncbi:MAG: M23 family metallopeptidase [Wenzhouxiangellaceae bacterium]
MKRPWLCAARASAFAGVWMLTLLLTPLSLPANEPEVHLQGQPVQGGLIIGQAPPGARVLLDGQPLPTSSDGWFLVGFGRDDDRPRRLSVQTPEGVFERVLVPERRRFAIQRIDGLPPAKVTPDPDALQRIREEAALVREARSRVDDRADFATGFKWPVVGPVTGVYGSQRILNGEPRSPHWGVDIAAPVGTEVRAPAAGVVTLVHPDMYFSGGTLVIDHGLGLSSAFLHLDEVLVEVGQRVEQGQVIARVGATGRVTGPHLDWRMNLGDVRIDPQLLLPPVEGHESRDAN